MIANFHFFLDVIRRLTMNKKYQPIIRRFYTIVAAISIIAHGSDTRYVG
jgi:hypothetical protein